MVSNTAPVLPLQSDRAIDELTPLVVTNTATDADIPTNLLTYQLVAPPDGATIDTNGVIRWTPSEAQGPGTYTLTTVVTDNGVPPMSATNSFTVTVLAISPPIIESIVASGGDVTISWSAVSGRNYRVQFKSDLTEPTWTNLAGDITSTGSTAAKTDATISGNRRYYRVVLLP